MLNKMTKILPMTIESEDSLDELTIYLTEHVAEYYKFKENHKTVSFWFGRRGHVFRITAEADIITPWLAPSNLFDSRPVVNEREFSKWEIQLEELVYNLNLELDFISYGTTPIFSYIFPMTHVKRFIYYMSLEEEDFYA